MRRHVYAWLVATIAAVFPTVATAGEQEDQQIADHINQRLIAEKDRGALSDFSLDLYVEDGQVWFKGHVTSAEQEKLVFAAAQSAKDLGVVKIYDMVEIKSARPAEAVEQADLAADAAPASKVKQTSTELSAPVVGSSRRAPTPAESTVVAPALPKRETIERPSLPSFAETQPVAAPIPAQQPVVQQPVAPAPVIGSGVPANFAQLQPMPQARPQMAVPMPQHRGNMPLAAAPAGYVPQAAYGQQAAPANYVPVSQPHAMGARHDQPTMPGYAWPSYASYPNYGAVTYPQQYSPTVWPYIGPFYPYPQVPLGWRKVTLEWDDGWWFLDFQDR